MKTNLILVCSCALASTLCFAEIKEEPAKEVLDPKIVEAMKINCETAKAHLQDIESKPRIRLKDKDGNVVFLTDEQRTQEIVKTKAAVDQYCQQK